MSANINDDSENDDRRNANENQTDPDNVTVQSYDLNEDPNNLDPDAEDPGTKGDASNDSEEESDSSNDVEHERRVQMLHSQILAADEANFTRMREEFFTEGEVKD